MLKIDEFYLRKAEEIALESKCEKRKVGCIIVHRGSGKIVSKGYNGPTHTSYCKCERANSLSGEDLDKCNWYHAERKAINELLVAGISLKECDIYITHSPCEKCSELIRAVKIPRVIFRELYSSSEGLKALEESTLVEYLPKISSPETNFRTYQNHASRTIPDESYNELLTNFTWGVSGEIFELVDYFKKIRFHDHPIDKEKIIEEAGDVLWYLSSLLTIHEISLEDVARKNIKKLLERYPEGFDSQKSISRKENLNG